MLFFCVLLRLCVPSAVYTSHYLCAFACMFLLVEPAAGLVQSSKRFFLAVAAL